MKDRRKDRRWYVPDDNEWAIQDAADVAGGPLGYADDHNGSACIVYTHNADIAELEAEIAKLKADVDRLTPDAKLGAAVRRMGDYARRDGRFDGHDPTLAVTLGLDDSSIEEWRVDDHALLFGVGDTPEAALKSAGLMED